MILQFIARPTNTSVVIMTLSILFLFILIFIAGKRNLSGQSSQKPGYRRRRFAALARKHNLEKHHIDLLHRFIVSQKISNSEKIFHNVHFLTKTLQDMVTRIRQSSLSKERILEITSNVFEIKQRITIAFQLLRKRNEMLSTRILKSKQSVTVYSQNYPSAPSTIVQNTSSYLILARPVNENGLVLKYHLNSVLKIRLIMASGNVYIFKSRLKNYKIVDGEEVMSITHSKKMTHSQLRRYPRKETNISAFFHEVEVLNMGNKKQPDNREAIRKRKLRVGYIEDISGQGCALSSTTTIKPGKFIRIRFKITSPEFFLVFGEVRKVRHRSTSGGLMHIAFSRVSVQHLNAIQAYALDFSSY